MGLSSRPSSGHVAGHPELTSTADICGQLDTELTFRIPLLAFADSRPDNTWLYDFRWPAPGLGLSIHCLELPFTWDLLGSDGVTAVAGEPAPGTGRCHAFCLGPVHQDRAGLADVAGGRVTGLRS